jgi:coenzyme PQQ precursor peptide PqqA
MAVQPTWGCGNGDRPMAWKKPVLVEVCVAMEINGYMPIEF